MAAEEKTLYSAHPSMFRNSPVAFIVSALLVPLGVGALILFRWWLKNAGTTLTITERRTILRKGILSRNLNEVLNSNVRNVQVDQSLFQRMLGVGDIGISSSAQADMEIVVDGIRDPVLAKSFIDGRQKESSKSFGFDWVSAVVLVVCVSTSSFMVYGVAKDAFKSFSGEINHSRRS